MKYDEALQSITEFLEKSDIRKFCREYCGGHCCNHCRTMEGKNKKECKVNLACASYLCSNLRKLMPKSVSNIFYDVDRHLDFDYYTTISKQRSETKKIANKLIKPFADKELIYEAGRAIGGLMNICDDVMINKGLVE